MFILHNNIIFKNIMENKHLEYTPINKLKNMALKRNLKPLTCKNNKELFS
jgi:hypothetical protein